MVNVKILLFFDVFHAGEKSLFRSMNSDEKACPLHLKNRNEKKSHIHLKNGDKKGKIKGFNSHPTNRCDMESHAYNSMENNYFFLPTSFSILSSM